MPSTFLNHIKAAEVEWKPLSELTNYEQPSKYLVKSTKYSDEFETPVLTAGKTFILGYTDEIDGVKKASINPVILFDDFTSATRWIDFDFKVKSSATKFITSKDESELMLKFLCYWLMTLQNVEVYSAEHKRLWISNFSQTKIPLPSLEIQQKVVEILDKMTDYVTELTAELTAELTLRQKQYAYYRDKLLTFPSQSDSDESLSVHWTTLGEIARLKNGSDWKNLETGNIPVYGSGGEMGVTVVKAAYDKPTVLIPRKGSISNLFYLTTPFWNVDTIYYTVIDEEKIVPKFFFYYLRMVNLEALSTNPSRPSLTQAILDKVKIPLPNLTEQKRIVESLDKFDKLTSDLSEGLPREIELWQKQYEYWREQLLSFR
ncbi:restriction endonuclease subunit S [Lactococcus taiwanensis]|uniref:restriction endonuclease subunit S n=1 Tax=Lactococcus taiwanensis TaxID=1151742 RepID=UPI0028AD8D4D|nr:restriction endonuclease subunit S [Lactococcus taiwanensis]